MSSALRASTRFAAVARAGQFRALSVSAARFAEAKTPSGKPPLAENTDKGEQSALSSSGSIGKQFNPDGPIGSIGEKIGGPFKKDGAIGSIFAADHEGVAGKVEEAVGGPKKDGKK